MKLHLLGIPHTYTHPKFSCCAFTGKVLRFSPMMRSVGYHVIHYGNAGSESGANEEVEILNADEYLKLGGCEPGTDQYGTSAKMGSPLYATFNARLAVELEKRVEPGDIICLPFGMAHIEALGGPHCQSAFWVETGIGYRNAFAPYRIYESAAWFYTHAGRENPNGVTMGNDYWFVIPNYYNPDDWPMAPAFQRHTIAFMGRLNDDKGLRVLAEIAVRRPDIEFTLCGQGDPTPWLKSANISYAPPIHGEGRAEYLGTPAAVIVPTRYVEPFGGVAAEALLCGTPVIASSFGAFPEYVIHGSNGWNCRTLADWLKAVDEATAGGPGWDRNQIQRFARMKFSMWQLAHDYAAAFKQISQLSDGGWYHGV